MQMEGPKGETPLHLRGLGQSASVTHEQMFAPGGQRFPLRLFAQSAAVEHAQ